LARQTACSTAGAIAPLAGEWGSSIQGMEPGVAQALVDELLQHLTQERF
jgi:hypothetical protein